MVNFLSKAQTLDQLSKLNLKANIAEILFFKVEEWEKDPDSWIQQISNNFVFDSYIVRSSSCSEDQTSGSNAGAYLSIPNVSIDNIRESVENVIDSYRKKDPRDEILIQPMLKDVIRSGVMFSHDPNTCSPYRIINWSSGNDTSQITAGGYAKSWQQAANNPHKSNIPHPFLNKLVELLDQLLSIFYNAPIDCEFAFDSEDRLWLLQVRPLVLQETSETEETQAKRLQDIESYCVSGMKIHPFLKGRRTIYGVMPDWNPAEILGSRPRPLALSLYKEMITDSIWAYQRHNYGYRNLRSFPLMPSFYGIPYIDVRLSFNSFIPADLDDNIANKLVDYYVERLLDEPTLHDKVEFEILFSCYTLDIEQQIIKLKKHGFKDDELDKIKTSLRKLTNKIIDPNQGLWKTDQNKIEILKRRRNSIYESEFSTIDRIYWLLEDGKRYGTLPFAGLARAGFIAVQLLKSLVSINILSNEDYDLFLSSINTISGDISFDKLNLDKSLFLSKYGHLRPGTYDILSPRYDEDPTLYFNWDQQIDQEPALKDKFSLTLDQISSISDLLKYHQLNPDVVDLFRFLQSGIEQREYSKFQFTKNLSDLLSLIGKFGEQHGFNKDDLSYSNINSFKDIYTDSTQAKEKIHRSIEAGKETYMNTIKISLPPLISKPEDVWAFEWPDSIPNFITQLKVTANVAANLNLDSIFNSIVCIPNADPGFDWLFSYPIAGLITAWGGANSHMAIRAGELKIPAVIGCGEKLFEKVSTSKKLIIDCSNKVLKIIE